MMFLEREERSVFRKTVQVIPHITDRIKQFIKHDTKKILGSGIGGIVGDIESLPFVEVSTIF